MENPTREDYLDAWAGIVARTWSDEAFKQRVIADPAGVLQEHDFAVPKGVKLRVVEGQPDPTSVEEDRGEVVVYLPLPGRPKPDELSEDLLESVSGGATYASVSDTQIARTLLSLSFPYQKV